MYSLKKLIFILNIYTFPILFIPLKSIIPMSSTQYERNKFCNKCNINGSLAIPPSSGNNNDVPVPMSTSNLLSSTRSLFKIGGEVVCRNCLFTHKMPCEICKKEVRLYDFRTATIFFGPQAHSKWVCVPCILNMHNNNNKNYYNPGWIQATIGSATYVVAEENFSKLLCTRVTSIEQELEQCKQQLANQNSKNPVSEKAIKENSIDNNSNIGLSEPVVSYQVPILNERIKAKLQLLAQMDSAVFTEITTLIDSKYETTKYNIEVALIEMKSMHKQLCVLQNNKIINVKELVDKLLEDIQKNEKLLERSKDLWL